MIKTTLPFTPDWVSSPGDVIADFLEERDWTQAQLAELYQLSDRTSVVWHDG